MESTLSVTSFLLLLMAVPRVDNMYNDGLQEIQSARVRAIGKLSYAGLTRFESVATQDIRKGVGCIDAALYGPGLPAARALIQSLLVRGRSESSELFERRTTETLWALADRVAVLNRYVFAPSLHAPGISTDHSYFHPWTAIIIRNDHVVNRQFPLLISKNSVTLDRLGKGWGGTGPGYQPLLEFDYYARHYPRRKLSGYSQ